MLNEKKIKLPLKEHSLLTYTNEAALLSVLYTNPKTYPWIYSNFINLCSSILDTDTFITFFYPSYGRPMIESCPECVTYLKIERDIVRKSWGMVTNLLLDIIQLGYYSYFMYDQFYIPFTTSYQRHHSMHMLFVFGFDLENKTFNCADFINGQYIHRTATFEEIENAYQGYTGINEWWEDSSILVFKIKDNFEYKFNKKLLVLFLNDFLNSKNSFDVYEEPVHFYGLEVYKRFIEYARYSFTNPVYLDIRFCGLVYRRMIFMVERLSFLVQIKELNDESAAIKLYKNTTNLAQMACNLIVKYNSYISTGNINGSKKYLGKVINIFENLLQDEKHAIETLIQELTDINDF